MFNGAQLKLIGFAFKYVWEEFTVTHPRVVREIKVETFKGFLAISDEEDKVVATVKGIFDREGIDAKKYAAEVQLSRARSRKEQQAAVEEGLRRPAAVVSLLSEDSSSSLDGNESEEGLSVEEEGYETWDSDDSDD